MSKKPVTGRKIKSGLKSFGSALGEIIEASAAASEERRRVETEARNAVTEAINDYETRTGKKFVITESAPVAQKAPQVFLPWDPDRKGHLINCRPGCWSTHCLACGTESHGSTYCFTHRP